MIDQANRRRGGLFVAALGAIALTAEGCRTDPVEIPDWVGNPVGTGNGTIVVAPPPGSVPAPAPSPAASPDPAPAPSPSTPAPKPSGSCALPPGTGDGNTCDRTNPSFLAALESSMDELTAAEPALFNFDDRKCGNCYFVRDGDRYVARMVELMQSRGLCVRNDGEELAVKNTNDFNDQYDILTADSYIRRGDGSYRSTCWPAWF